jgi:hypothetical protein
MKCGDEIYLFICTDIYIKEEEIIKYTKVGSSIGMHPWIIDWYCVCIKLWFKTTPDLRHYLSLHDETPKSNLFFWSFFESFHSFIHSLFGELIIVLCWCWALFSCHFNLSIQFPPISNHYIRCSSQSKWKWRNTNKIKSLCLLVSWVTLISSSRVISLSSTLVPMVHKTKTCRIFFKLQMYNDII